MSATAAGFVPAAGRGTRKTGRREWLFEVKLPDGETGRRPRRLSRAIDGFTYPYKSRAISVYDDFESLSKAYG